LLKRPTKTKDIQVKIFYSGECAECGETLESTVNQWLKSSPEDIVVHDIIYQYCIAPTSGLDVSSLAVIYGKAGSSNLGVIPV